MADQQTNPADSIYSDISVKLRDIEEKQNIIKDRVLLIGENLVFEKENIDKIKNAIERMIDDTNNFVRKNEFEILQRQFQMFQPLELARISDVEDMINKAIKKTKLTTP